MSTDIRQLLADLENIANLSGWDLTQASYDKAEDEYVVRLARKDDGES